MIIPLRLWERHKLYWLPLDFQVLGRFLTFLATLLEFLVAMALKSQSDFGKRPYSEQGWLWESWRTLVWAELLPPNCSRVTQAPLGTLPGREQTGCGPDPPSAHPPGALPL